MRSFSVSEERVRRNPSWEDGNNTPLILSAVCDIHLSGNNSAIYLKDIFYVHFAIDLFGFTIDLNFGENQPSTKILSPFGALGHYGHGELTIAASDAKFDIYFKNNYYESDFSNAIENIPAVEFNKKVAIFYRRFIKWHRSEFGEIDGFEDSYLRLSCFD